MRLEARKLARAAKTGRHEEEEENIALADQMPTADSPDASRGECCGPARGQSEGVEITEAEKPEVRVVESKLDQDDEGVADADCHSSRSQGGHRDDVKTRARMR